MTVARAGHAATFLNSEKVLVTGGTSDANEAAVGTAELYDPATGTFTATTGNMTVARVSHTATLLKDGKVLVTGGDKIFFNGVPNANIQALISADAATFAATGDMTAARESHIATLLSGGKVLITGGSSGALGNTSAPTPTVYISAELFDPSTGHFTATGSMTDSRDYHAAVLLSTGKVLVSGGANLAGFLQSADLFDANAGTSATTGKMMASASIMMRPC